MAYPYSSFSLMSLKPHPASPATYNSHAGSIGQISSKPPLTRAIFPHSELTGQISPKLYSASPIFYSHIGLTGQISSKPHPASLPIYSHIGMIGHISSKPHSAGLPIYSHIGMTGQISSKSHSGVTGQIPFFPRGGRGKDIAGKDIAGKECNFHGRGIGLWRRTVGISGHGERASSPLGNVKWGLRGKPLFISNGVGKRRGKMATMAVPRALIEDTDNEALSILDVESPAAEYGTFGGATKAVEDVWGNTKAKVSEEFSQWDSTTARLADSATAAFLLLQLPQIILNSQNLIAGNNAALSAVPWLGQLTSLLGNLSLLSYFASKRERGAMVVQAVGVVSTTVVLSQLALAGAMPFAAFAVVASVVVVGLLLNILNFNKKLSPEIWRVWGEVVSIGGVTVLPQVMWSTFEPQIPHSILPGAVFGILAVTMVVLARLDKLPKKIKSVMGSVSAWTATLLFMWAPVAQWWTNYLYPANIRGLSVFTVLLAMLGNSLLLPRALFIRDFMWFAGSGWGCVFQGWGILVSMYIASVVNKATFWGVSGALFIWLSSMLWRDSKAFDLSSPLVPLIELVSGKRL